MRLRTIALPAALLSLSALVPSIASAGEARASGDVPVRWGPGSGYEVIGYLDDGDYYEVEDCTWRAHWCVVSVDGEELGWVRGSYLVGSGAKNQVTPFEFLVEPNFPFQN